MGERLRYLSICSGIEAASVAWAGLGWSPVGFAEIDKFASAVLAERFGSNMPGEPFPGNAPPNFGDFTAIPLDTLGTVDLLVGGTPCQAFSFAGKRLSLEDARGNLTLAFAVLAHELAGSHGCRNAVWENVPGVLSTSDNAFGCFLGALVGADAPLDLPKGIGRWPDEGMVEGPRARAAWRVLDAQYFGLAQRRERVFVVVDFGNGADPAAVLFEPQGLRGNSPPRREAGQRTAGTLSARTTGGGGLGTDFEVNGGLVGERAPDAVPVRGLCGGELSDVVADVRMVRPRTESLAYGGGNRSGAIDVAATLTAKGQRIDFEVETFIAGPAHTLRGEGFDASEDGTGRGTPLVPVALRGHSDYGDGLPCLRAEGGDARGGSEALIAFDARQSDVLVYGSITGPLDTTQPGPAIAFSCKDHGADAADEIAPTLREMGHGESHPNAGGQVAVAQGWAVRRLTPVECARLQGFPDGHSRIPWRAKPRELCPDGPQYKTYGNSMAVPVMRWIGERIAQNLERTAA